MKIKEDGIIKMNIETKANDIFKVLISKISVTQFLKLYQLMTDYLGGNKNE